MLVYIKPLSVFPKLHSDTLFGAILSSMSELYPDKVNDMITEFENNNPPFLISSAFPFIFVDNRKVRFLPKIILKSELGNIDNISALKEYKKVEFIEEEIFFNILNHNISEADIINDFDDYSRVGNLLMIKDYGVSVSFDNVILPNNSINRLTNETDAIFYSEGVEYGNMGLYFYVNFMNDEYESIIKSCLKFLKDRGFGRDISTGKGQFDYEIDDISIENTSGSRFIILSRFIPTSDDLTSIISDANYELESKRGRDKTGEIRKQIRFFKEGSTFRNSKEIYGQIIESGINVPACEYGYAFIIKYDEVS